MRIKGFRAGAVAAQLRYKDRFDLAAVVAEQPAAWAGVFTRNICQAAPVLWSREKVTSGRGRAFLANAGQANAQTGAPGLEDCRASAEGLAAVLGCRPEEILLASTGVIGQPLNMEAMSRAWPTLGRALRPDGLDDFAAAIMTTDTFRKTAEITIDLDGRPVALWGAAKGSGMIAPNMATMLGFILTDAAVAPAALTELLREGAAVSFNRVTVDGDTSTNDSLFMMASGVAGPPEISGPGPRLDIFKEALFTVLKALARDIARDGEGANHLVTVRIGGAANLEEAEKAARTVAESPLVKTALYGRDANWGRILAALGRSGARFDPYRVDINLNEVPWVRGGRDNGQEEAATRIMAEKEYVIGISLGAGAAEYEILTCDLSHEYVNINGSYRS